MKRLFAPALFLLLAACAASYTSMMTPVIGDLNRGMPEQAIADLKHSFSDSTGDDRLLYLMELGNLARYSGQYGLASSILLAADRLSDVQRGTDLGQQAEAMLTSDLALEFRGADYEKVFINYALAASYAAEGNIEDAVVEARRVNEKLLEFNDRYGDNPNRYTDDAFIRYFMGILYEMDGDLDDALISYRLALAAYDSVYSKDYGFSSPERLRSDAMRLADAIGYQSLLDTYSSRWPDTGYRHLPSGSGEIVAVVELGTIAPREERDYTVVADDRVYRLALPVLPDFSRRTIQGSISAGGVSSDLFLVQDMNGIARENLLDQAGRNVIRAAARLTVKAGVAELGESIAEEFTDDENVSSGIGLVLSIFGAATEQADMRSWLTLPGQIHMTRMTLPAGTWPVTVNIDGFSRQHTPVQVRDGEITLLFIREDAFCGYRRVH
ncbi:hypothetical protein CSA37_11525 [Candidatus Fermentibacteria bacterium]|nr:MAG: hypothetical protein CSA37_11525 [Candidatus Fermentibacteria bacterium]